MGWQTLSATQKREAVIALCRQGLSNDRIAERLGAPSHHAVAGVIRRAKANGHVKDTAAKPVRKRDWDQAAMQKAANLWRKGWPTSRIAVELGVSRNAIVGIAGRNRDLFPNRSGSPGVGAAKPMPRQPEADIRPPDRQRQNEPSSHRKTTVDPASQATDTTGKLPVRTKDPAPRVDRHHPFEPMPGCEPVTLVDLSPMQCRWPVNGFDGDEPIFCGQCCERDETYCVFHQRIAYRRTDRP